MKKFLYLFPIVFALLFAACSDNNDDPDPKPDPNPTVSDNEYVNGWIYDELEEIYLWNDKMSAKNSFDLDVDPYDFFYQNGITYNYGTRNGDRFSYLEGTHASIPKSSVAEDNTTTSDIGFEYMYIQYVNQAGTPTGKWAYLVVYVKNGTEAEKEGIKRGHLITKVNNTEITDNNRIQLLSQNLSSYELDIEDYDLMQLIEKTVKVTYNYTENPIHLYKVFTVNNQKVGYIVYNSYKAGAEATLPYDVELMKILTDFQTEGVKDIILDLRYNGGGLVRSAQFLTSALVPDRNTNNIFEIKTYNTEIQSWLNSLPDTNSNKKSWMYDYFVDNVKNSSGKTLTSIPKLGNQIDNLYVLCTARTASASEMTVNTLRPYMKEKGKDVILIGAQTTGKNVGSWAIYEDDKPNNTYVMWPIIFKSHNKNMESDYANGFTPNIVLNELSPLLSEGKALKNLGDEEEVLLSAALSAIKGETKSLKTEGVPKFIEKGSSLDEKPGAYKMYENKDKTKTLKSILKSAKGE